jgi:hypothetical protein
MRACLNEFASARGKERLYRYRVVTSGAAGKADIAGRTQKRRE